MSPCGRYAVDVQVQVLAHRRKHNGVLPLYLYCILVLHLVQHKYSTVGAYLIADVKSYIENDESA